MKSNIKDMHSMSHDKKPFWQSVAIGALHCGSGCTIGDMLGETLLLFVPVVILGSSLAGSWVIDYIFAFVIGIIFQYYALKPMKHLSVAKTLKCCPESGYIITHFIANRNVWLDGYFVFCNF